MSSPFSRTSSRLSAAALRAVLAFSLCLIGASSANALPIIIFDDFEDGTTEFWFAGGAPPFFATPPNPPANVPNGGPAGAGDAYLEVQSHGLVGPGNRPVAMNASQWALDYLAADIIAIEMDVRNFGNTDLFLRLLFEDPIPLPPNNIAASLSPVFVPAGSDWMHVVFPIAPGDLATLLGSASAALANTTVLRIFHDPPPDADFPGPPIAARFGVDNIAAVAAPEPSALALVVLGAAMATRRALQRRARGRDRSAGGTPLKNAERAALAAPHAGC